MTDNRTTELREMLDERGIKYETNDYMGVCETSWNGFTVMQLTPGAKLIMTVTPEQAVAATLGSGTLTADDIRCLIERHSDESGGNGRDFHNGAYVAIADELNARAERTCEIESSFLNDFTSEHECWYEFEMKCGYRFTWGEMEPPRCCPNCGGEIKAVKRDG